VTPALQKRSVARLNRSHFGSICLMNALQIVRSSAEVDEALIAITTQAMTSKGVVAMLTDNKAARNTTQGEVTARVTTVGVATEAVIKAMVEAVVIMGEAEAATSLMTGVEYNSTQNSMRVSPVTRRSSATYYPIYRTILEGFSRRTLTRARLFRLTSKSTVGREPATMTRKP
jgi:hypothetical protein